MSALIATTKGNGPYTPVIVYNRRAYHVGPTFERIEDALEQAILLAARLRDEMRWHS
jgi:hypothetical protein